MVISHRPPLQLQDLLCQLRTNIIQHLTAPLNAEPDSQSAADGNEYDRSLDTQAKIETFLQAYELALADRLKGLNGQQSLVETQRVGRNRTGEFLEEAKNGAEPSGLAPQKVNVWSTVRTILILISSCLPRSWKMNSGVSGPSVLSQME